MAKKKVNTFGTWSLQTEKTLQIDLGLYEATVFGDGSGQVSAKEADHYGHDALGFSSPENLYKLVDAVRAAVEQSGVLQGVGETKGGGSGE